MRYDKSIRAISRYHYRISRTCSKFGGYAQSREIKQESKEKRTNNMSLEKILKEFENNNTKSYVEDR